MKSRPRLIVLLGLREPYILLIFESLFVGVQGSALTAILSVYEGSKPEPKAVIYSSAQELPVVFNRSQPPPLPAHFGTWTERPSMFLRFDVHRDETQSPDALPVPSFKAKYYVGPGSF